MNHTSEFHSLLAAARGLKKAALPITALACAALAPGARAASDTWTGASDALWSNTGNWLGGTVPGVGNTATFNAASGNTTVDLGAGVTISSLLFDTASASAYTIGSGGVGSQTLTIGAAGTAIQMNATVAANQLLNANLAYGGNAITVNNSSTTNTLTIAGNITGTAAFTKNGAGALVLSGTNSSTGNLLLSAGRINVSAGTTNFGGPFSNIGSTASTSAALNVSSGATFGLTGNNGGNVGSQASASGVIYNAGTFNQTGTINNSAGIYLGNANNAYGYLYNTGTTAITGRLWIGHNDGGTVTNGAAGLLDIASGTVTVTGTNQAAAFQINAPNKTYSSTGGFAGVNITGGTLALMPSQTYQTNTGVGLYSSVNVSGASSKITTGATGGFNLNNTSNALNSTTFTIANGGEVDTSFISNTGSAASSGILTFDNGKLKATAADATGLIRSGVTTYIQSGGATIDTNGFDTTVATPLQAPTGNGVTSIALGGTATGYVGAPIVQITGGGGTGAAAIANFDPATGTVTGITITAAGSGYTSAPTITLVGGNGGATGAGVGTATGTASIGAVTSGGLTKTGTGVLTLSAANTFTGATNINNGTLKLANSGSLASTTFNIAAGASFDVSAQTSYSLSGKTITLSLNGVNGGSINAGSLALDLGGTLTLNLTTGTPAASYTLFTAGSTTGNFGLINLSGSFSGSLTQSGNVWTGSSNGYNFSLDQTTGALSVAAVPEPGVCALLGLGLAGVLFLRRRCA